MDGALAAGTHSLTMPERRTSRSCSGKRTQKCLSVERYFPSTWSDGAVLMEKSSVLLVLLVTWVFPRLSFWEMCPNESGLW